ncbi:MAG: hypothetical protein ACR2H5_23865 [Ktedonobacteraceae bacterium]
MSTPDLSQFGYNRAARRYVDLATGRFVSANDVRAAVDTVIDATTVDIRNLAGQLVDGKLTVASWQTQMAAQLKALYVACGVAAGGGFAQMDSASYGYLGLRVKPQYQYLRNFAAQIANGQQPPDGTLIARAALYAQAARGIFEAMAGHLAQEAGCTQEKSNLGIADSCALCIREAAKSWSAIGSLLPVGQRTCLSNCRCTFSYK